MDVDVSKSNVKISFVNLDSLLVNTPKISIPQVLEVYTGSSEGVLAYQLIHCLGIGGFKDSSSLSRIELFRKDPYIERLESQISKSFTSKNDMQIQLMDGFKHLNYKRLNQAIIYRCPVCKVNLWPIEYKRNINYEGQRMCSRSCLIDYQVALSMIHMNYL